jgi:hypothetical protein
VSENPLGPHASSVPAAVHLVSQKPLGAPASSVRGLLSLILLTLAGAFSVSCGKIGPPVPPSRIRERTGQLSALQRGNSVLISWPVPRLGTIESSTSYIDHVDIYRLNERRDQQPILDADDFKGLAYQIGYVDRRTLEEQVKTLGAIQFVDPMGFGGQGAPLGLRLRYAIRYVNKRGQESAFSNTVAVEPLPMVAGAPSNLHIVSEEQDAITLEWNAPEANVDGTAPATIVGYNVYRSLSGRPTTNVALNSEPLSETTFTDKKFRYLAHYIYTVRALSQGTSGLIESTDSNALPHVPKDTYPPAAPHPVSIASANGVISLFWPTSPERDVVGYNVYRSESAEAGAKDWIKLTPQAVTTVTFRDDRVQIGGRYYYRVTAMDKFDNESQPSEVLSETANP